MLVVGLHQRHQREALAARFEGGPNASYDTTEYEASLWRAIENGGTETYGRGDVDAREFFGRVHNLVVVLPRAIHERGGTEAVLGAFREHDDWRRIRSEVEDYVFMHSGSDEALR